MKRCSWCGDDELYIKYHDREWGVPVYDDRKHFEFMVLESAQAGLSWLTILKKREGYREAYANFDPKVVAGFSDEKIEELLKHEGIIKNGKKIKASVNNAQRFINSWNNESEIPTQSDLSVAVSKDLKKRGFTFLGPIIVYSHLQATGVVNDHIQACFRYRQITSLESNRNDKVPAYAD